MLNKIQALFFFSKKKIKKKKNTHNVKAIHSSLRSESKNSYIKYETMWHDFVIRKLQSILYLLEMHYNNIIITEILNYSVIWYWLKCIHLYWIQHYDVSKLDKFSFIYKWSVLKRVIILCWYNCNFNWKWDAVITYFVKYVTNIT